MVGHTGHGMLSRSRSHHHKKLRIVHPMDLIDAQQSEQVHSVRQRSGSIPIITRRPSSSDGGLARKHWPPIEWDPLKLNPPVAAQGPEPPARLHERQPLQVLRPKRSFAGHETARRPARLHHSDSGLSLEAYHGFDFSLGEAKAVHIAEQNHSGAHQHGGQDVHHHDDDKGWPSPASSVDSGKSWFEDETPDEDDAVQRSHELWENTPGAGARPRPQVASPDDPGYFIQRGAWKRRAIFFGGESAEVYQKDDDAFHI
ncbi:hypothetical protein M406DRAFT_107514 [Cryphonectria parasitica EP155]|uniref:Uncharacterized protein n=1 Tax=Cryphonectria parasitica (strain ATCC 38755 / EP155) TaxID=660469 RepID=A0A9P5CSJ2_CRYP1|nr:uncharacterized protein M406DRAFT_107514 [Cryphonectria parasitica EP155]KAF3768662.1 hypothetical protein M406DRAFT_107514 [Cryphonectria parasitica EP155]